MFVCCGCSDSGLEVARLSSIRESGLGAGKASHAEGIPNGTPVNRRNHEWSENNW
jgi:hypothetical protein